jgi:FkbM family methyltransferase
MVRKLAPLVCRWVSLEEGFDFLRLISFAQSAQVLDVGANDGTSIRMILRLAPGARISSFDPVRLPDFKHKLVSFYDFALGDKSGEIAISTPVVHGVKLTQYSSAFNDLMIKQLKHDLLLNANEISIETSIFKMVKLDDLNLIPFFMKVDVEGAEHDVIIGSVATIQQNLPIILIEIQNQVQYGRIYQLLKPLGYFSVNLDLINNGVVIESGYSTEYNNFIWISKKPSPTWSFKI